MTEILISREAAHEMKLEMNANGENVRGDFRFWITPLLTGTKSYRGVFKDDGEFERVEEFDLKQVQ